MRNDPDLCDAYGYGNIQYNDGYLYTDISEYNSEKMSDVSYILRVSEDGTKKEKNRRIECCTFRMLYSQTLCLLPDKYRFV